MWKNLFHDKNHKYLDLTASLSKAEVGEIIISEGTLRRAGWKRGTFRDGWTPVFLLEKWCINLVWELETLLNCYSSSPLVLEQPPEHGTGRGAGSVPAVTEPWVQDPWDRSHSHVLKSSLKKGSYRPCQGSVLKIVWVSLRLWLPWSSFFKRMYFVSRSLSFITDISTK